MDDHNQKPKKLQLTLVSGTDRGLVRNNNEDACLVIRLEKKDYWLAVLADGMGGHKKGDVASRLAVNSVAERLFRELAADDDGEAIKMKIVEAAERANVRVYLQSLSDESMQGMGTTLLTVVYHNNVMYIGHIGDCRAYLLRQMKHFYRITTDHTYVQALVDSHRITEEEALVHRDRHKLIRALGLPDYVSTDLYSQIVFPGDRWLFCSDGLHGYVSEFEIARIVQESNSPDEAARALIDTANHLGGNDNVTVIVGFVEEAKG